jgi:23S rRNA (uracil1939-C5)-methyltransferase
MAHGGEAVGLLPDGRTIFVAGGIPGETVRVRITKSKKRWARAELVEVTSPSEDRIEAPCAHFGECGGCQWQHIDLNRQRALKRDIVIGQLQHLGAFEEPPVEDTLACGREDGFGYRNHAQFAVNGYGRIAYHRSRSRKLVGMDSCPLLHPLLGEWADKLPAMQGAFGVELRAAVHSGQRLAMVRGQLTEESFAAASDVGIPLKRAGYDEITEVVGEDRYQVSSKSFFQVNSDGAATLVRLVLEMAGEQAAGSAIDLYAGVGLFTVPLARAFGKLYAVESHPAALRDLRKNCKGSEVHIVGTRVEDAREQLPPHANVVVADPPR